MDNQILRELFLDTINSYNDLVSNNFEIGPFFKDTDFNSELLEKQIADFKNILPKIPSPTIHSNGTIREWNADYEEAEPGHRHISHLWALYPGHGISIEKTPELVSAAKKTLERRRVNGGGHTGWSRAWIINFRASLNDGDGALNDLNALFEKSTLPNLFDNHPPFQIDGNLGALAGIIRMIIQSEFISCIENIYNDENSIKGTGNPIVNIKLLPALPSKWDTGELNGVLLKGNLIGNIKWKDSKVTYFEVENNMSESIQLVINDNLDNEIGYKIKAKNKMKII